MGRADLPEGCERTLAVIERIRAGERIKHEFRIRRASDGEMS
ncbi:hypothetical protein [Methylobacterium soli]|nr:hypothetical protein [Methylobacterium soli]